MMNFQFCGKLNYWAACGTQLWNELSLSKKRQNGGPLTQKT